MRGIGIILLAGILVGVGPGRSATVAPAPRERDRSEYASHYDHILGTSLDLIIAADEDRAFAAEDAILAEIERLRTVFSLYDPESELSRLNRSREAVSASNDMIAVLRAYEKWQDRTGGALSGQLGELVNVWKAAEKSGRAPDQVVLDRIVQDLSRPGWRIDSDRLTVTRLTDQPLNLNAIAKGYIAERAASVGRVAGVRGLLVNLGGDIRSWGATSAVGIQDPFHSEDNAKPLAGIDLANAAVATSGGYQRFYTIGGKRYSHILDPRSGRPAGAVASATVIAADGPTANALATTLCVLDPEAGLKLVATEPGAECLILAADGTRFTSPGLKLHEVVQDKKDEKKEPMKGELWPADHQVKVQVELPTIANTNKYRRPYVAIWIENAEGKPVRTLAVWGQAPKYLKDLFDWWKFARGDNALIKAVTRATRGPGKYDLSWDGKDEKGNALPQGTYTLKVEVHREHGKHIVQSGKIECKDKAAKAVLEKNEETAATTVEYAKKK